MVVVETVVVYLEEVLHACGLLSLFFSSAAAEMVQVFSVETAAAMTAAAATTAVSGLSYC